MSKSENPIWYWMSGTAPALLSRMTAFYTNGCFTVIILAGHSHHTFWSQKIRQVGEFLKVAPSLGNVGFSVAASKPWQRTCSHFLCLVKWYFLKRETYTLKIIQHSLQKHLYFWVTIYWDNLQIHWKLHNKRVIDEILSKELIATTQPTTQINLKQFVFGWY